MKISIISAMSENRVIGRGGKLPWDIPEEYAHYLKIVRKGTVIMGRKSFTTFGEDLKDAEKIVLSRNETEFKDARRAADLDKALRIAESLHNQVFIAGGASVYEQAMDLADQILLSVVRGSYEGDTYFPEIPVAQWEISRAEEYKAFTYQVWVRK